MMTLAKIDTRVGPNIKLLYRITRCIVVTSFRLSVVPDKAGQFRMGVNNINIVKPIDKLHDSAYTGGVKRLILNFDAHEKASVKEEWQ